MSSTESSFARGEKEATGSLLAAQYPQTCKGKVIFYYAYSLFLGEGEQDSQEKDEKIKKIIFFVLFLLVFAEKSSFILHNNIKV